MNYRVGVKGIDLFLLSLLMTDKGKDKGERGHFYGQEKKNTTFSSLPSGFDYPTESGWSPHSPPIKDSDPNTPREDS